MLATKILRVPLLITTLVILGVGSTECRAAVYSCPARELACTPLSRLATAEELGTRANTDDRPTVDAVLKKNNRKEVFNGYNGIDGMNLYIYKMWHSGSDPGIDSKSDHVTVDVYKGVGRLYTCHVWSSQPVYGKPFLASCLKAR